MSLRTIFTDKLWFRLAHLLDRAGRVYKKAEEWKGIKSVLEVCRKRSDNGKETQKKVFYISRLDIDIQTLAKCVREHWEVESKAHWVLDVVYKEDECAVTDKCGAENLVILRRLALNLARLHPKKQSIKGKLTAAGWSDEFRDELLLGVQVEKWATYAVALKNG